MKSAWALVLTLGVGASAEFRVCPYLQNPAPTSMSILWCSTEQAPGRVRYWTEWQSKKVFRQDSKPRPVPALNYSPSELERYFAKPPAPQFQHEVRLSGLKAGTVYRYEVEQGGQLYQGQFKTAPGPDQPVRFVAYSDSETEPESTGAHVRWPMTENDTRRYLIDQTDGYAANLAVIRERQPDFIAIAGDLVECGGEQRDWDEFWRHNTNPQPQLSTAGQIPILPAPGNHDYFSGPRDGLYKFPHSEWAIGKYLSYFRVPDNGASQPTHRGRYYRLDYGPISYIVVDGCNGQPHQSAQDSNWYQDGSAGPDFNPGSEQYRWLEKELQSAQQTSKFTFVCFHHCPYSSGWHGAPPGLKTPQQDPYSGHPLRVLTPLFHRYGVDVLLCGHDEFVERSEVVGEELRPDGSSRPHTLQVYDVGVGGDGLRGPLEHVSNPYQKFLVHRDSPEVWKDGVLVDGGKHYGHLEVNVRPEGGRWLAELRFVYVFPVMNAEARVQRFERRVYSDQVDLFWP